ncbi:molybdenum cofactor guanylyltransferase [Algoriphagus pacificus]|uniref:Probable molybdenum cofactor guanylyltransferase n=1 Tax=Algoriphagus pacificus TaxID=2811234 RepID=A0ABS3CBJ4_9BACT|nr:molybdenum cofactor guanylyltransferase [Algoriphagus pacificus]MBN7814468.1 molybdenum cofactor guanylyltransferase [Algoriphagus pacificus]
MLRIKEDIAVYILCGGKSSRMKTEKGLVEFHGRPFLQWILDAVTPLTSKITLVTKNPAYASYGLPMIPDLVEDQGPVGGIFTALADSSSKYNLILSCDIPKISTEVLDSLIQSAIDSDKDVCILSDGKHDYPLIGCYQKYLLPAFQQAIEQNHLKLCSLVDSLRNNKLVISQKDQAALRNINTPAELLSLT